MLERDKLEVFNMLVNYVKRTGDAQSSFLKEACLKSEIDVDKVVSYALDTGSERGILSVI